MKINNFNYLVYKLVKQIPKGKVSTYKAIAEALESKAYRRIGRALNQNKDFNNIPCHRVINSNGYIGGYSRGINIKKKLLISEGIRFNKNNKIKNFNEKLFTDFFN